MTATDTEDSMTIDYGDEPNTITGDSVVMDTDMGDDVTLSVAQDSEDVPIVDAENITDAGDGSMAVEDTSNNEFPFDAKPTHEDRDTETVVTSPATTDAPSLASHPGFRSPPHVAVSKDELQISALGHSAVTSPQDAPQFGTAPYLTTAPQLDSVGGHEKDDAIAKDVPAEANGQSQTRNDLSRSNAMAKQHQHRSDSSLSQDQMVENLGQRRVRIRQEQSMSPDTVGQGQQERAVQENEINIREVPNEIEGEPDEVRIDTKQHSTGGAPQQESQDGLQQYNEVNVYRRGTDLSGIYRPVVDTQALSVLNVFIDEGDDVGDETKPYIPSIELVYSDKVYSVFSAGDGDPAQDSGEPILFDGDEARALYYGPIEVFTDRLRDSLSDLDVDSEIRLNFEFLGVKLSEDSVYSRDVSLFDIERLHFACKGPRRLKIIVESEVKRLPSLFKLLTDHGLKSHEDADESESAHPADHDRYSSRKPQNGGDDFIDGEFLNESVDDAREEVFENGDGEYDETADAAPAEWQDEDVQYISEEGGDVGTEDVVEDLDDEGHHNDSEGEQAGDLEEALAELDSDDLNAVIEGAEEDYVLSETFEEDIAAVEDDSAQVGADFEAPLDEAEVVQHRTEKADDQLTSTATTTVKEASTSTAEDNVVESNVEDTTAPVPSTPVQKPWGDLELNLSYDTPKATGNETPAVPLDRPEAVVDAAAASSSLDAVLTSTGNVQSAPTHSQTDPVSKAPEENEDQRESADVVIDYEEAETPTVREIVSQPDAHANGHATPPKRSRDLEESDASVVAEGDPLNESKRPRLEESTDSTTSA